MENSFHQVEHRQLLLQNRCLQDLPMLAGTNHEAFLALAETTGDVDYASKLLIRDSTFSEELYEMAQSIDVDQYIALRPANFSVGH